MTKVVNEICNLCNKKNSTQTQTNHLTIRPETTIFQHRTTNTTRKYSHYGLQCHTIRNIQGDHSPDTLKFPDISLTMPMLSGTHSMPAVLVLM